MKKKLLRNLPLKLSMLAVLVSLVGVSYIVYLALYPFKTIDFTNQPFPIVSQLTNAESGLRQVYAGQILEYEVSYCRHTHAVAESSRTLVGPILITLTKTESRTDVGCQRTVVSNTIIPSYALPGKYHLQINVSYKVNPFQTIDKQIRTEDFEILPAQRDEQGNVISIVPPDVSLPSEKAETFGNTIFDPRTIDPTFEEPPQSPAAPPITEEPEVPSSGNFIQGVTEPIKGIVRFLNPFD